MKYIIVLGDGMADYPIESLGGKTPLSVAKKPTMNRLARLGTVGMVKTVPDGLAPGSDVANLGVLGYDARKCYTGRSPLEALSMGVILKNSDVAIRTNFVTLSDEENFEDKTMLDYSGGEISSAESAELMKAVQQELATDIAKFYTGVSYRHLLLLEGIGAEKSKRMTLTPPHDITGKKITNYLPKGEMSDLLSSLLVRSHEILKNHKVNQKRVLSGQKPANNLWFWGQGTTPALDNFAQKYGKKGAVISAVDLLKGIAVGAGLTTVSVQGATGTLASNFDGKAQTAIEILDTHDFVFVHLEAPDECGHQRDLEGKIKAIEIIDEKILTPVVKAFEGKEDFRILVLPDHRTPIALGTHTGEPVPFFIYDSREDFSGTDYDELSAEKTGLYYEYPWLLTEEFFKD